MCCYSFLVILRTCVFMGITKDDLTLKDKLYAWWEGLDTSGLSEHQIQEKIAEKITPETDIEQVPPDNDTDILAGGERTDEPVDVTGKPIWTASRVKVAEKLWGDGFVIPYSQNFLNSIVKPLGIKKGMSVLDLTAGIGSIPLEIARSNKAWIIGLEESPLLADIARKKAAMQHLSKQAKIFAYNSSDFELKRKFDYIFSQEKIYTFQNKENFIKSMRSVIKPTGQFIFTDYVAAEGTEDALKFWAEKEPSAQYLTTALNMEKLMRSAKFTTLPVEDITKDYQKSIYNNLKDFLIYAETVQLDDDTAHSVKHEIDFWSTRLQAIELGLRLIRVQGIKS